MAEALFTVLPHVHPALLYSAAPMSRRGACYQRVHKPELFHIDATGAGTCGAGLENTI